MFNKGGSFFFWISVNISFFLFFFCKSTFLYIILVETVKQSVNVTYFKNLIAFVAGICMLLTVLEEQAMESLLLGPDKQNDFLQALLNTMDKETDGTN